MNEEGSEREREREIEECSFWLVGYAIEGHRHSHEKGTIASCKASIMQVQTRVKRWRVSGR